MVQRSSRRVVSTLGLFFLCGVVLAGVAAGAPAADAAAVVAGANESTTVQGDAENATVWERTTADDDVVGSSASGATTPLVELNPPYRAGSMSSEWTTQTPQVAFNRNVTFDGGNAYRIVIHDADTGGKVTVTPPSNLTVGPATRDALSVYYRSSLGTVSPTTSISAARYVSGLNTSVTGPVSTSGIVNQSVALVDATTGRTVARTNAQPYVVGYNRTAEITVTSSAVEFSVPRAPFPADANVSVEVFNASGNRWNSKVVAADTSYDGRTDSFVTSVDTNRLGPGAYSYTIAVDHPSGIDFRPSSLEHRFEPSAPIFVPGGNRTGVSLPGTAGPARSADADSLLEDVDGDGRATVGDVLAYYDHRGNDVVRNNPAHFDFDRDGTAGTVSDALALYDEID